MDDGPFDLALCALTGQMFRWTDLGGGRFLGLDGGRRYGVQTRESGEALPWGGARATGMNRDPRRDALRVAGMEAPFAPAILEVVSDAPESAFRSLLRLDLHEGETRAEIVRRGPELAPYLAATRGLRLLRPAGRVESLFSFVLSANNNVPRIASLARKLGEYGENDVFPDVETIAALPESELRAKGFGYRARSVVETARAIVARGGEPYLADLAEAPFADLTAELRTLRGVGPKVAECVALFAFDRTEAVPIDTHLWQAIARLYPRDAEGAFTPAKAARAAERFRGRFGPYAARAQQALFYDNLLNWRSRKSEPALPTI